jgi:hypothetical protein
MVEMLYGIPQSRQAIDSLSLTVTIRRYMADMLRLTQTLKLITHSLVHELTNTHTHTHTPLPPRLESNGKGHQMKTSNFLLTSMSNEECYRLNSHEVTVPYYERYNQEYKDTTRREIIKMSKDLYLFQ